MSSDGRTAAALQKHFGFSEFREGQEAVINSVLNGDNSIVVMPTGGGKSLCYQLPAMMSDGVSLVISPLIALMKDQVDQLTARRIPTTFINSSLSYSDVTSRLARMREGRFKLVYIAPERFRNEAFINAIKDVKVKLFAVDEAHCISHWGHDFRPDYLRLREAVERLGSPQVIALTATATSQVRSDIARQLGLQNPRVFIAGFDRPNLALRVFHSDTEKQKLEQVRRLIARAGRPGIIYAATRKTVEQITSNLKMAGLAVEAYHAGMEDHERTRAQEKFMSGKLDAMTATNAFGMGIDKPDIRFVVHYHIPGSIEAYYQEIGRAGRDGLPSECLLLFNYADTRTQQFFIDGSHPSPDLIAQLYRLLASIGGQRIELSARELAQRLGVKNDMSISSALVILEKAGHIERGRASDSFAVVSLKKSADSALAEVAGDSVEAELLRHIIFETGVLDREAVELDMSGLASALSSQEPRIKRAFNDLAARDILTFRNTFRGKGIRFLDEQTGSGPRIDRREIEARAGAEQRKLRSMIDYCYAETCLRQYILEYFGDPKRMSGCASCSNCTPGQKEMAPSRSSHRKSDGDVFAAGVEAASTAGARRVRLDSGHGPSARAAVASRSSIVGPRSAPEERNARPLDSEETTVVKKILSCVARMKDRFGKGVVAAVLQGSKSKQVIDNKLDRLSTYGLLSYMNQDHITAWIKELLERGCIAVNKGPYPTVRLTDYGREVMTGKSEVRLVVPA